MELASELSDNRLKDDDQALDFDRLLVVEFVVPERESEGEKAERIWKGWFTVKERRNFFFFFGSQLVSFLVFLSSSF